MATGAMIMGIMKMEVATRDHMLSEQMTMATIRPRTTSRATEIKAKVRVFRVLVCSMVSLNILA